MTIHSSKGLEFNNVVIYKNDFNEDEERKRLRYVAFTRARKRLFIVP
jgi:superfamily I DNA/RNA helicase